MTDADGVTTDSWALALSAANLIALDPHGLGGANLRAAPGPVRSYWLDYLRSLLPAQPIKSIPSHISESRLLGGVDIASTLAAGKPVAERGLLCETHGGVAVLTMAERAQRTTIAHLCAALDHGTIHVAREGIEAHHSTEIALIAMDEGLDDEATHPALQERLAFFVDLHALSIRDVGGDILQSRDIATAREHYFRASLDEHQLEAVIVTASALGVRSPRGWLMAARAARGLAALEGRSKVEDSHLSEALQLCLAPRATRLPQTRPEDETQAQTPPEAKKEQTEDGESAQQSTAEEPMPDQLLEAAAAAIPDALLSSLLSSMGRNKGVSRAGKAGAMQRQNRRGRPAGVVAGDPRRGGRLSVIDTLRAAVPWQRLRQPANRNASARITVQRDDFRLMRFHQRSESTTVFVVDASGSAALHRLAEAKGAVELLLAECYVRRDEVALIAFRGEQAELLLPPTRSLVRAKKHLAGLPGGGGTPLASAIEMADRLSHQIARQGATVGLVFLTDGVANICRDGSRGRQAAAEDAQRAAARLRDRGVKSIVIDTAPRANDRARSLANALDADYLPMPHADAERLKSAIDQSGVGRAQ